MLGGGVTGVWELGVVTLESVGGDESGVGGVGGSESVAGWSVAVLVAGVGGDLRWVGSSMRARWYLASCSGARVSSVRGVGSVVGLEGIVVGGGRGEVGAFGSVGVAGMGIGWSWAVCVH